MACGLGLALGGGNRTVRPDPLPARGAPLRATRGLASLGGRGGPQGRIWQL